MKRPTICLRKSVVILIFTLIFLTNVNVFFGQKQDNNRFRVENRKIKIIKMPIFNEADWLAISKIDNQLFLGNRNGVLKVFETTEGANNFPNPEPVPMNQDKFPLRQIIFPTSKKGYALKSNSIFTPKPNVGWMNYYTQPIVKTPVELRPDFWNIGFSGNNACIVGVTLKKNAKKEDVVDSGLLICNQDIERNPGDWKSPILPESFRKVKIPSQLTGIDFIDGQGWLVGAGGIIWHSKDNGISWEEQNSNTTNPLLSIDAIEKNKVWAVGFNSTILYLSAEKDNSETQQNNTNVTKNEDKDVDSTDNNSNTNKTNQTTREKVAEVSKNAANKIVEKSKEILNGSTQTTVVVTDGTTTTSTTTVQNTEINSNKTATWKSYEPNPLGDENVRLWSVKFASNKRNGWIIGDAGTILQTTNGGETWEKIRLVNDQNEALFTTLPNLYAMHIDEKYCWIVGSQGVIVRIEY